MKKSQSLAATAQKIERILEGLDSAKKLAVLNFIRESIDVETTQAPE